jgi:2-keto-4-pentenoate hydratase/2-oxohepta-3-ene-1,7-dioic acid hydratase in catechol pathway
VCLTGTLCAAEAPVAPDSLSTAPRVIRYISSLPDHKGETCYGMVTADANGIPIQVRALRDRYPQLCYRGSAPQSAPELIRLAFQAADRVVAGDGRAVDEPELEELLEPDRLSEVVLPPVAITRHELDTLQRFVIGIGLNYTEHLEEVGSSIESDELLVFPKPVVPTGPYAPVRAGVQIGELPPQPVLLLDYEVELGLVLLKDIDLGNPPNSYEEFLSNVAFFTANDVSDREPIILELESGYTRGKSHPGYLPIGPWLVSGARLRPRTVDEGEHSLEVGALVREAQPAEDLPFGEARQLSTTDAMLRGPWSIIVNMSRAFRSGHVVCMRDADLQPRFVHDARGIIPAGSIILTGTPGGTAIREPRLLEKAELFLRGGFSREGARKAFIEVAEHTVSSLPYLETGDEVESWVETLGRQRWTVSDGGELKPYGVAGSGACEPGTRPQPVSSP